jgi:hypothetical protein
LRHIIRLPNYQSDSGGNAKQCDSAGCYSDGGSPKQSGNPFYQDPVDFIGEPTAGGEFRMHLVTSAET